METDCSLTSANLRGNTPPTGTSQPAATVGPSCAIPGQTWEARIRKTGETEIVKVWEGFVPPAIDDPDRLIFWYPYPATIRGDWLAPWEKPLPAGGENYYPAAGEFNDPYRDSGGTGWVASRYQRLMREAWDEFFPEYPTSP